MSRLTKPRGFTLIEIMVVVSIIGVMTSLSVVGYQSVMRNARTNGEADALGTMLKNGRLRAVSTGCPHVVRYDGYDYNTSLGLPKSTTVTVYRKADCSALSAGTLAQVTTTTPAPDIVVNTFQGAANMLDVTSGGLSLSPLSYMVGFGADGLPVIATKTTGGTVSAIGTVDQTITLKSGTNEVYTRNVVVSGAGDVFVQ
jgi:prepilin-type N-terminal cleavage/methylation domain-containing protein